MAQAYLVRRGGGGGTAMNYAVTGSSAQPVNPSENTIWINTTMPLGVNMFSSDAPTTRPDGTALQSGDLWLVTGSQSAFPFNALKGTNSLIVYGQFAFQWTGAIWQPVLAQIWYGGAWVDWGLYLYKEGNECVNITGGWIGGTKNASNITIRTSGVGAVSTYTSQIIDLTTIKTLKMRYTRTATNSSHTAGFRVTSGPNNTGTVYATMSPATGINLTALLDVSALTGSAYVTVSCNAGGASSATSVEIYELWGEG